MTSATLTPAAAPVRIVEAQLEPCAAPGWPRMPEAAFYGLAAMLTQIIGEENCEADWGALLVTVLTSAAACFGAECTLRLRSNDYPARLYTALISTSPAHQGAAFRSVREVFMAAQNSSRARRKFAAATLGYEQLVTGDDFIKMILDIAHEDDGEPTGPVLLEDKASPHRLIAIRQFGPTLNNIRRSNSPLGPMLSEAWYSAEFNLIDRSRTRIPARAHVCLLGQVPLDVLRTMRQDDPGFNATCSQFLWTLMRPREAVWSPESTDREKLTGLTGRVASTIGYARKQKRVHLSAESEEMWRRELYPQLAQEPPGVVGTICSLGSEMVLRLSLVYALLDESALVLPAHLRAADAVWRYCRASVRYIFGQTARATLDKRIRNALSSGPKTQSELHRHFGNNFAIEVLVAALSELQARGLVEWSTTGGGPGKGRPVTTWTLTAAGLASLMLDEE